MTLASNLCLSDFLEPVLQVNISFHMVSPILSFIILNLESWYFRILRTTWWYLKSYLYMYSCSGPNTGLYEAAILTWHFAKSPVSNMSSMSSCVLVHLFMDKMDILFVWWLLTRSSASLRFDQFYHLTPCSWWTKLQHKPLCCRTWSMKH